MGLNIDDYRIIAISSPYGVEKSLSCAINNCNEYEIICISENSVTKNIRITENVKFVLINPDINIGVIDVVCKLKKLCFSKTVILYLHNSDIEKEYCKANIDAIVKAVKTNDTLEIKFSHEPSDNKNFKSYKTFLECTKNNKINKNNKVNNTECLRRLIEESLKKRDNPYLIALSILCQGYLAAHGGAGLEGWENVAVDLRNKASETEKKSWWGIITKSDDIDGEIKAIDKGDAKTNLSNLVAYLKKNENLQKGELLPLVVKAYDAWCKLEAGRFL